MIISSLTVTAHPQHKNEKSDRTEWYKEMGKYKAEFMASELKLTDEQKKNFIQLYQEMENSSSKMARETRQLEKQVRQKGDAATDTELEKAAEARAELKAKQGKLEKEYFAKFKKILTPK
ncbi:MAG: Spy/CpxP family protein refolding chaperone, partial [Paramuribaculum sp.]|nr:Spy/CpxP family protein refolding chaperone [Paramuribaculum sp.]